MKFVGGMKMTRNKRWPVILALVLVSAMAVIGCDNGTTGGGVVTYEGDLDLGEIGFDPGVIYGGGTIPPSPVNESQAQEAFMPLMQVLQTRIEAIMDVIEDSANTIREGLTGAGSSVNETYDVMEILEDLGFDISGSGITALSGSVTMQGSGDLTPGGVGVFNFSYSLNYEYDSDVDFLLDRYSGEKLFSKGKVNFSNNRDLKLISNTEVQTFSQTCDSAYADYNYCGLATCPVSYKRTRSETAPTWTRSTVYSSAGATFSFYDLNGKQTYVRKLSKDEAIYLFGLD